MYSMAGTVKQNLNSSAYAVWGNCHVATFSHAALALMHEQIAMQSGLVWRILALMKCGLV